MVEEDDTLPAFLLDMVLGMVPGMVVLRMLVRRQQGGLEAEVWLLLRLA